MATHVKKTNHTPFVLAILDGWGIGGKNKHVNPLMVARLPFLNRIVRQYPYASLKASGQYVGLPRGQDGNSEAGHLNLGAGRIVEQESVVISRSIKQGTFFKNAALLSAVHHAKRYHSNLHLMGLLSNYNSGHSSPDHFMALLKLCQEQQVRQVFIHFFTDGRDSPKYDALKFIGEVERRFRNGEVIASLVGRFYAMDRKKNWSRTAKTYNLLTRGEGLAAPDAATAIRHAYNRGESDEFLSPSVIVDAKHRPVGRIEDNDAVIFFNLRSDRARQMAKPFVQRRFEQLNPGTFRRRRVLRNLLFVAMTDFGPDLGGCVTAFPSADLRNTLPMVLRHLRQLYISEMEKYAHVTYFFNGGYTQPVAGEDRLIIPSPRVASYDQTPAMAAPRITSTVIAALGRGRYDFVTLNYPNPDMVGHTGNFAACVKALEAVDGCLAALGRELAARRGSLLVTGDHGNVEELVDLRTGEINTDHSTNPVPGVLVHRELKGKHFSRQRGILGDVAPTILDWLGLARPGEMTGRSLFRRKV